MTFSENELHDIVELVVSGIDIEIAKQKISERYTLKNKENIAVNIANYVLRYFGIESLIPISRKTEDIGPMNVYAFLLHDIIPDNLAPDVYKTYTKLTNRHRTSYYYYQKLHDRGNHLFDYRYFYGDTLTNHFLNLKTRITGEELEKNKIEAYDKDKNKGLNMIDIKYRDNKEDIIQDIDNFSSYTQLNNRYFNYKSINNFRRLFDSKFPQHIGKIRTGFKVEISKVIDEHKDEFIRLVRNGYTFKQLNDYYTVYSRKSDFKRMMLRHEPQISKMILENENK